MASNQVPERVQIVLQEYQQMRHEIDNRTQISNTLLLGLGLALGTGLTVVSAYHEVLLGMAVVTSFLWVLYLDHTESIFKAAAYIVFVLSSRLQDVSSGALGWEIFRRRLEGTKATSWAVLHPRQSAEDEPDVPDSFTVPTPALSINLFVGGLFLGLPFILILAYFALTFTELLPIGPSTIVRWLALVTAIVFLIWAVAQTLHVARSLTTIEAALSQYENQESEASVSARSSKRVLTARR